MNILFFGPQLARPHEDRRSRILSTLLEGVFDRGHHVVYVSGAGGDEAAYPYLKFVTYDAWAAAKDVIEQECDDASAIVVVSGFAEGPEAVDWLLELPVPAHAYYDLDPWETLAAFEAGEAAPWVRADQIGAFDLVLSVAGGPAVEAFKAHGAEEVVTLYEAIDPAVWHPRSPEDELACDLALVADRDEASEVAFEGFMLEAARALPSHRFLVVGSGWKEDSWPANIVNMPAGGADYRAMVFSSARGVLVPVGPGSVDYALPIELLEPAACAAACVVVDRPGLGTLFKPGDEIVVAGSGADLVPYLTTFGDNRSVQLGHRAEKRVVGDYVKLRAATKFEQRLARKFYRGHNG